MSLLKRPSGGVEGARRRGRQGARDRARRGPREKEREGVREGERASGRMKRPNFLRTLRADDGSLKVLRFSLNRKLGQERLFSTSRGPIGPSTVGLEER